MFTVQTKSMLAKLMASENIRVEHRNTKTACFNLKTRVLTCPSWKDMSGDLYDLLMGHEISHALRTPMEGWHDSVTYAGGNKKASQAEQQSFRHFLNVVEDARIEKLVKRQYPGLRRPMIQGYKELLARDFFGISAISNFNDLYLIDKLNLAAKCGTLVDVKFSAQERPFYDALMAIETWDEVVELSKKLYNYSKAEQQQGEKKKQELADYLKDSYAEYEEGWGDEEEEEGEGDDSFDSDEDEEGNEKEEEEEEGNEEGKNGKESDAEGEDAGEDKSEEKADDRTTQKTSGKGSKKTEKGGDSQAAPEKGVGSNDGEFIPKAKTDESFREAEESLVATTKEESYYLTIPTPNLKDIVVSAKTVNDGLTPMVNFCREAAAQKLADFKKKNEDYISLLAKEFEMKKAARSYAKAKISDSGDININKLANYRLEDNIFRKMIEVHKGKSHGLVLILDKSGSMSEHIEGAMEQILVMAMFCRKVNIPFVAYSFTNCNSCTKSYDFKHRADRNGDIKLNPFSEDENDLRMGDLDLREMFNSKMSAGDFSQAIMNHLMLANGLRERKDSVFSPPSHERMGGTPLNEALVVLRDIIRQFKMNHRLDIVNAIVVHDGDSDGNREFYVKSDSVWGGPRRQSFYHEHSRVTLIDKKENLQVPVPQVSRGMTIAIMKWLQMTAHCGVFGFYITGSTVKSTRAGLSQLYQSKLGISLTKNQYRLSPDEIILADKLGQEIITSKYLESFTDGYTRLYFIPGDAGLRVEQEGIVQTGKNWTPSRLLTAFKKVNKKKNVSRVLVTRFIELMAV